MGKKNTQLPPEGLSFKSLINHIWDHGLGNDLTPDNVPIPWTPETFETTFFDIGFEVDPRSFQNWRGGVHKADRQNIHAIAKVVSAGNYDLQQRWATTLLKAPKIDVSILDDESSSEGWIEFWQNYRQLIIGILIGQIPLLTLLVFTYLSGRGQTTITDLTFCDDTGFSKSALKCHQPASHFPSGTTRIYVSFDVNNSYEGQPFERRWYLNSVLFLEKSSFFDTAWPGYTYLGDGTTSFADGKYDLRIIVDKQTTTKSFLIGIFDPRQVHPDHMPELFEDNQ